MDGEDFPQGCWLILSNAFLAYVFLISVPLLAVAPLLPMIMRDLNLSYGQGGFLFSIPMLMIALFAILGGILNDRIGSRAAVALGGLLVVIGSALRGVASTFVVLALLTVLYGIGRAIVYPGPPKLIVAWFPSKFLGTATSVYGLGFFLGSTVATALTGTVILRLTGSWQAALLSWGVVSLLVWIIWLLTVRNAPYTGMPHKESHSLESLRTLAGHRSIWLVASIWLLINLFYYVVVGWFPTALPRVAGVGPEEAGYITSLFPFLSMPGMFVLALCSDRLGLRKPFIVGIAPVLALLAFAIPYSTQTLLWPLLALLGFTYGYAVSWIYLMPIELVREERVGSAAGLLVSIGYMGGLIGPPLVGYLIDITGNFRYAMFVPGVAALLWMLLGLLLPETGPSSGYEKI